MKRLSLIAIFAFTFAACDKDDGKSIVDCLGESIFLNAHHSISGENPMQVNYSVTYEGSHTLNNTVKWDFGDGTQQTVTGTDVSHAYSQPGNYTATASVKVSVNGATCSSDLHEHVTIQ